MKKNTFVIILFFATTFVFGATLHAEEVHAEGTKKIGDACSDNNECKSNTCDDSYCTCGDTVPSAHCAAAYGGTAENWKCVNSDDDPDTMREDWNFCKKSTYVSSLPKNSTEDVRYPVEEKKMMGQPCNDDDACWDPTGTAGNCQESSIPSSQSTSDPAYDPWYVPQKNLKVCAVKSIAYAQEHCEYQYGSGSWGLVLGSGELTGLSVCQKTNAPALVTLQDMRKSVVQSTGSDQNNTTIFGFNVDVPEVKLVTPTPKIGIPGVFFSNITRESNITTDPSGTSWINIPFLGEYIAAIYKYSVGLISLIAVLVLIVSGVQITTSAGNSETISGAKHRITSAVIALIITAGSYTILYTINPELVNLRSLRIIVVPGNTNYFSASPEDENAESDDGVVTDPNDKSVSFLPTDPIRIYEPKGAGPFGAQYLANCSMFPNSNVSGKEGAKARIECRKACVAQLDEKTKSKKADTSYSDTYLGAMDCSAQGTRSLASIKHIGIHEGGPGAIGTWWASNVRKQLPVGSHYFITPDGVIHQIADETFVMWHGVQNQTSIGIDLSVSGPNCASGKLLPPEDVKNCTYTQAQYDSLNRLINEITNRLGGRRPTLLGHCESGNSDHVDPRNFDWTKVQGETNEGHRKKRCAYVPGYPFGVRP